LSWPSRRSIFVGVEVAISEQQQENSRVAVRAKTHHELPFISSSAEFRSIKPATYWSVQNREPDKIQTNAGSLARWLFIAVIPTAALRPKAEITGDIG
jgi:hypothetical protein